MCCKTLGLSKPISGRGLPNARWCAMVDALMAEPLTAVSPMAEPFLSVSGLMSGYGDIQILWGIDFDIAEGEAVCLVGSNGAGKSTLLRTLSGLIPARAGKIRF